MKKIKTNSKIANSLLPVDTQRETPRTLQPRNDSAETDRCQLNLSTFDDIFQQSTGSFDNRHNNSSVSRSKSVQMSFGRVQMKIKKITLKKACEMDLFDESDNEQEQSEDVFDFARHTQWRK